jgi:Uma2 family endonuclease
MVHSGDGLSAADYEALPEEVCRQIEIVDGGVVVSPSPRRAHQRIARRLANALEAAASDRIAVEIDVDLRLRDVPLLLRRPDVVVYDGSLSDDVVLRPEHCLLLVEVMSPGSVTTDRNDKPSEYAASGIEHFWRVEFSDEKVVVFRYRLEPTSRTYVLTGSETDVLIVTEPLDLKLDLDELR